MNVQECGRGFNVDIDMPVDPLGGMMTRQVVFQRLLGHYDDRLSAMHPLHGKYHDFHRTMHNLDMARHEAHEAWDMLEGGWKHHKTVPTEADPDEVLMEIVDVLHFLINAYLFQSGVPSATGVMESLTALKLRQPKMSALVPMGLEELWRTADGVIGPNTMVYDHGSGAHGKDWEKRSATAVNLLAIKISEASEVARSFLANMNYATAAFPPSPGFIINSTFPFLMAAARTVPGCTPKVLYAAFIHKNDINLSRQDKGY